ncbi:MAG: hypothetical protein HYX92_20845 [Chloroflexi bacterium]|nr:hypothetical protein [Chloroflexota bacterium]
MWSIHDAVRVEKAGVPAVAVIAEEFAGVADTCAKSLGYPDLKIVTVPHPLETKTRDEILRIASEKLGEIASGLTEPAVAREATG